MDIEQLKLILEMVGSAGEGTKDLAIIYLAVGFLKALLGPSSFIVFCVIASRLIRYVTIARLEWYRKTYPHNSLDKAEKALANAGE